MALGARFRLHPFSRRKRRRYRRFKLLYRHGKRAYLRYEYLRRHPTRNKRVRLPRNGAYGISPRSAMAMLLQGEQQYFIRRENRQSFLRIFRGRAGSPRRNAQSVFRREYAFGFARRQPQEFYGQLPRFQKPDFARTRFLRQQRP